MTKQSFKTEVGGKELTLEISALAEQANAAVLAKYGDTVVLGTAVMSDVDSAADYMPLKVDYEERFYAAGKILGSRFLRREGRPSDEAVLSGRLIDRTVRPLFDHRLRRELQVIATVLSIDEENDPDFVALVATSAALAISDIPWNGPAAGIKVARIGSKTVINPTFAEINSPDCVFEAFVTGPSGRINMIELGGKSIASEADVLTAFEAAQKEIDMLVEFQRAMAVKIGKAKREVIFHEIDASVKKKAHAFLDPRIDEAVYQPNKMEQAKRLRELKEALHGHLAEEYVNEPEHHSQKVVETIFEEAVDALIHKNILESEKRPDGRRITAVRKLDGSVGLFKRTHGSALFVRGNTQALAVTTLAAPGAEQLVETMETNTKRRFMLHYNFPPYSVGEVGRVGAPGRREIGHGVLARKAIEPLLPSEEEFPYTVRVVSEILSSNGSSSMATVCASTLSLMDAGVPLKAPVAGIAMGLVMNDDGSKYKVLTDLQGPEDHYGDMDFKVAGTKEGITAIQLDVKVHGLTMPIVRDTLAAARDARLEILGFLGTILDKPRAALSPYAPAVLRFEINPEKIGMLIGPGGKMINGLIDKYKLETIDVEDDGRVYVAALDQKNAEAALEEIKMLMREFAVGDIVEGEIIKLMEFGAIVDLGGGQDGMIHVSELREGFVKNVTDVVKMGDFVRAKVIRVEDGRIGLSMKQL